MIRSTPPVSRYIILLAAVLSSSLSALADGSSGSGTISVANSDPIVQSFDSLSNTTQSNVLPTGWYLTEIGTGSAADGAYAVGTGSSNSGGAYSFGASGSTDRALGNLGSGSVTPVYYGAQFVNNTGGVITALAVSLDGEMWRRGTSTGESVTFAYSTSATALGTGSYTNFSSLNLLSPGPACSGTTGVATDGNTPNCRVSVSATISGLSLIPGAAIWIRWTDTDTSGSDDGLGVDNVSVAATISFTSTPPTATASASPNPTNPGQETTLSGTISQGYNPPSLSYTVSCNLSTIGGATAQGLPVTGTTFSYNATVAASTVPGPYSLPCSVTDDQGRGSDFTIALTVLLPLNESCNAEATKISSIQGSSAMSPLVGEIVDVEAIVAGDFQAGGQLSGFYLQSADGEQDGNPATSEGLFIFSSTEVQAGDRVRVRGKVAEFTSSTGSAVSSLTELGSVTSVQVCGTGGTMPAPADVTLPVANLTDWERYEGMLVRFNQQLVVTGNFSLGQYGQIDLAPAVLYQPTQFPGDSASWAAATDLNNRSRIALDDASTQSGVNLNNGTVAPYPAPGLSNTNTLRVGALVNPNGTNPPIPLAGILDDRYGFYRIQPMSAVTFSNGTNPRPDTEVESGSVGGRFKIVSANVLNYFTTLGSRGAATATELEHQRAKIVTELAKTNGDVIGLSELQNFANGQTNGGTYTNAAVSDLTAALAAATGKDYQFLDTIDPTKLVSGNDVADNGTDAIRSGILYNAGTVAPVGPAALYYQDDQNRPTLAQTFKPMSGAHADQQTFTVVVNHFRSKGSACGPGNDDPNQGNCNGMRLSMANNVRTWLEGNPTADPAAAKRRYILIGDFNAYYAEDPIQAFLGEGGYTNLIHKMLGPGAYSYNFGSQAGYLDHAMVNAAAVRLVKDVVEVHVNADEPAALQALDSDLKSAPAQEAYYAPNEFAASDHDPIVIGFNSLAGDFNDDGDLDVRDYVALLKANGQTGGQIVDPRMDMNQDGTVNQKDFVIWQIYHRAWEGGQAN